MNNRVKNPLAHLLANEPSWANPEESIGEFITMIDSRKRCWKAKGRAREVFETLAKDIKTHSDKCLDSIPGSDWVTWSIYMIGKNPQTAAPVVMFFCEERRSRRMVQDSVKQSEILKKYPGIKTGNAAFPPDLDQLEQLASDTKSLINNFNISLSQNKLIVKFYHGNSTSTRIATAGGIVHGNGDFYVFTAGHLFYKTSTSRLQREPKLIDVEWEIDSDSDNESNSDTEIDTYDKEFVESTSRASESCSNDGSSDAPSTSNSPFSDDRNAINPLLSPMQAVRRRVSKTPAFEDLSPTILEDRFGRKSGILPPSISTATGGHLVLLSADFDYALIKFKGSGLLAADDFEGYESAVNILRPTHVLENTSKVTEIITYTVSGGLMTGTLHSTPSYTRLPNSMTFQKVYTVRLNGALVKGDCGSWVVDAESRGLCGHIVAGSERTGIAYIMSAHQVFRDANEHMGGQILLGCDFASEAISSNDASERAGMVWSATAAVCSSRELRNAILHPPPLPKGYKKLNASSRHEKKEKQLLDYDSLESPSDDSVLSKARTNRNRDTESSEYSSHGSRQTIKRLEGHKASQRESYSSLDYIYEDHPLAGVGSQFHQLKLSDSEYEIPWDFRPQEINLLGPSPRSPNVPRGSGSPIIPTNPRFPILIPSPLEKYLQDQNEGTENPLTREDREELHDEMEALRLTDERMSGDEGLVMQLWSEKWWSNVGKESEDKLELILEQISAQTSKEMSEQMLHIRSERISRGGARLLASVLDRTFQMLDRISERISKEIFRQTLYQTLEVILEQYLDQVWNQLSHRRIKQALWEKARLWEQTLERMLEQTVERMLRTWSERGLPERGRKLGQFWERVLDRILERILGRFFHGFYMQISRRIPINPLSSENRVQMVREMSEQMAERMAKGMSKRILESWRQKTFRLDLQIVRTKAANALMEEEKAVNIAEAKTEEDQAGSCRKDVRASMRPIFPYHRFTPLSSPAIPPRVRPKTNQLPP